MGSGKNHGKPARDEKGRLLPGHSGNPRGRPKGSKGLAARLRDMTRNGEDVAEVLVSILMGTRKGGVSAKEQLQAAQIILDRMHGKVPERIHMDTTPERTVIDVTEWTEDELRKAKELGEILTARKLPSPVEDLEDG